jgi:hypothetical protein
MLPSNYHTPNRQQKAYVTRNEKKLVFLFQKLAKKGSQQLLLTKQPTLFLSSILFQQNYCFEQNKVLTLSCTGIMQYPINSQTKQQ